MALAKLCYQHYRKIFQGPSFVLLRLAHVWPQTPLWASTGTKDPAASDVRYVEPLIGAQTITTLPDITLAAVRDHGRVEDSLMHGMEEAEAHRTLLAGAGIDLEEVGDTLQMEGVQLFMQAYQKLLKQVQE